MKANIKLKNGLRLTIDVEIIKSYDEDKFEIEMLPFQLAQAHIEELPEGSELKGDILILPKLKLMGMLKYN